MKNELKTIGQIYDQIDSKPARILYVISKLKLKPVSRAGGYRLFSDEQIERIRQENDSMNAKKERKNARSTN